MNSNISIVLLSLSAILGAYIMGALLFSSWFGHPQDCQYNIGCYEVVHSINRTDLIIARLADIQHLENISNIQTSLQSLPLNDAKNFQNASIQLALSFEKFIKKLTTQHDYNLENIQIYR
jgi:hypothetical protein